MPADNLAFLTHSHKAIAAKKKAKRDQIKEVLFDDDARREFLTGFHKRKLAKADAARKKAAERDKQERLETRREARRMLREKAIENAAQVEAAYGAVLDDDEWSGISLDKGKQKEEEYEDEEILATVTVVEDFDPDTIIHGPTPAALAVPSQPSTTKTKMARKRDLETSKKKFKEKKVRYQTKGDRNIERTKQRKRRSEKAELAGGKASRKRGPSDPKKRGSKR